MPSEDRSLETSPKLATEPLSSARARTILGALFALFALSRTVAVDSLPIFVDEARHLNWARRFVTEAPFLKPLDDGKLLQIAATAVAIRLGSNPLRAARLTSVAVGALGLWTAYRLGRELRGRRAGLLAALAYLVAPFTLVYDGLNLADGYLAVGAAGVLLATFSLARRPGLRTAVVLAAVIALCVLVKAAGLILFAVPVAGVALLNRRPDARRFLALALALAIAAVAWPLLRFWEASTQIEAKAALHAAHRLPLLIENTARAAGWLWSYWTPPLLILAIVGGAYAAARKRPKQLLTAFAALLPVLAFVPVAFHWFPRYLLFATIPALALAGDTLAGLLEWCEGRFPPNGRAITTGVLLAVTLPALAFDVRWLTDPVSAPLPESDRFQLVSGWPSGYGWREAALRLKEERRRYPAGIRVIADRSSHRTGQWALTAYFMADPGVEIVGLELRPGRIKSVLQWAGERPTYFVTSSRGGPDFPRRLPQFVTRPIGVFVKPGGEFVCEVLRLWPRSSAPPTAVQPTARDRTAHLDH